MCHTQFDFGILREQNILSLNVSVNHMMGVKMGKTLQNTRTHRGTQSDDYNHHKHEVKNTLRLESLCAHFKRIMN